MNFTKKRLILLIFILGASSYAIIQNYFFSKHTIPNITSKYKYEVILTPEKHLERIKAKGKYPKHNPAKTLILCYDEKWFNHVLENYTTEQCDGQFNMVYFFKDYPETAITYFGITAPLNAMRIDIMLAWGVKRVIAIGTSVGLQENIKPGDILVCEKSIRDEGTSYHYIKPSKYAYSSKKIQQKFLATLQEMNQEYKIGTSWTTDGFYRSTKQEVEQYQKEGVLCAEMESAAIFAVAECRKIDAIALFTITDSYAKRNWEKELNYEQNKIQTLDKILKITLQAYKDSNETSNFLYKEKIMTQLNPTSIYKIIPTSHFSKNNKDDCVKLLPIDIESGFIHTAFGRQVEHVVKNFFKENDKLLLLELEAQVLEKYGTVLKIETNKPGGEKFPHFYGTQKIPLVAIKNIINFKNKGIK